MKKIWPLILLTGILVSCGKNKFKRSDFLEDFYDYKIWPELVETENQIASLSTEWNTYITNPNPENLTKIKTNYKNCLSHFEKIAFYNLGDITAISVYNAAYKTSIDTTEIWLNYSNASTFNTELIHTYGNKEKGIFALEYLLFHTHAVDSLSKMKYQNYVSTQLDALTENYSLIKNSWSTYHTNFVANTDEGVEGSYNIVINRIVHLLEDIINKRISPSLSAGNSSSSVGYYSVSSWKNIKILVAQIKEIYLGEGSKNFNSIYNSVHKKNKKLADDLKAKLEGIVTTGNAMNESLDYYSSNGSTELNLYKESLTEILILFKLDVVAALDIVLTFGDSDGD